MRGSGGAKHVLSPWEREQYRLLNEKERPAYAVPPERFERSVILERERQTASDHSEVILGSAENVPAEIVHPANVRGNADFESTPKLADRFAGSAVMDCMKKRYWNFADTSESVENNFIAFPAAPDHSAASPNVRRKTRAGNRITKGKGSQHLADRSILAASFFNKGDTIRFEIKAGAPMCIEDKSFNTDSEITMEKVFDVDAAAKGVVATEVSIKSSVDSVAFRGALDDVGQARIRRVLGTGGGIGSPQADIPLIVRVPLRTGRRCDLFHFFARICRPGISESKTGGKDH